MLTWIFYVVVFLLLGLVTGANFRSVSVAIFVNTGLTGNPEIGNTTVWVLINIWWLDWVRDTKFGTNVSNEKLLDAGLHQGYSFYRFWDIKEKPTGW